MGNWVANAGRVHGFLRFRVYLAGMRWYGFTLNMTKAYGPPGGKSIYGVHVSAFSKAPLSLRTRSRLNQCRVCVAGAHNTAKYTALPWDNTAAGHKIRNGLEDPDSAATICPSRITLL
jgi:hypothetical protein